jgi:hypothetical protein
VRIHLLVELRRTIDPELSQRPDSNEVSRIALGVGGFPEMYIFSVRATNVYEEQSLGIFHWDDQLSAAERAFKTNGSRMAMWGRYLATHARYQLSFGASLFTHKLYFVEIFVEDMWWLALALFLVCIIEVCDG